MKEFKKLYPVNFGGFINLLDKPDYRGINMLDEENNADAEKYALLCSKAPEILKQLRRLLGALDLMFEQFEDELPDGLEECIVPFMAETKDLIRKATIIK